MYYDTWGWVKSQKEVCQKGWIKPLWPIWSKTAIKILSLTSTWYLSCLHLLWYEVELEITSSRSGPPSNLSPPSNSELQGPPYQPLNITYDPLKLSQWWDGYIWETYKQTEHKMQVTGKVRSKLVWLLKLE